MRLARNEADQDIDVTVSVEPSLHHRTKHGQFRDAVPFRGATDRVSVDAGPSPRIVDTVVVDYAAVGSVAARRAS